MKLIRYTNPEGALSTRRFGSMFSDLFTDFFENALSANPTDNTWPRVDVEETGENYLIKAEIPGISKENINIEINNNMLSISGEKKEEKEVNEKNIYRKETFSGSFCRSFSLPENVNTDNIDAKFENGMLTLSIPKEENRKTRKIEIR